MPAPERLREFMREGWNHRIIVALLEGAAAGAKGWPLGERAGELGYTARSAEGDAFEMGWEYGEEVQRHKERSR